MSDESSEVSGHELGRWLAVAILFLVAIGLFFRFARTTAPVAPPLNSELAP